MGNGLPWIKGCLTWLGIIFLIGGCIFLFINIDPLPRAFAYGYFVCGVPMLIVAFLIGKLTPDPNNPSPRSPVYVQSPPKPKSSTTHLNPWLSIWFQPAQTIRQIVASKPNEHQALLAMLAGIYTVLDFLVGKNTNLGSIVLLLISLVAGSILGLITLHLVGGLLVWWGRRLGGPAQPEEVRASIAWSGLPDILLTFILIPAVLINGGSAVTPNGLTFAIFMNGVGLVLLVWRVILLIACVAEVNHFSFWGGLKVVVILLPFSYFILWASAF